MRFFAETREVLKRIQKSRKLAFHIITNLEYGQYLGRRVWKRRALEVVRGFLDNVYLYEWNEDTCGSIITACDLALIPLPLGDPMEAGKPENKLLLFWRLECRRSFPRRPHIRELCANAGWRWIAEPTRSGKKRFWVYWETKRPGGKQGKKAKPLSRSIMVNNDLETMGHAVLLGLERERTRGRTGERQIGFPLNLGL